MDPPGRLTGRGKRVLARFRARRDSLRMSARVSLQLVFVALTLSAASCESNKGTLATVCSDDSDCAVGECVEPGASEIGQCTYPCQSDEDCVARFDEGTCLITCDLPCSDDAECPEGTGCRKGACYAMCSSDEDCSDDSSCGGKFCDL